MLTRNRRLDIRIFSPVLEGLQARAAEEGLPHQTLIASLLHGFATGRPVERRWNCGRCRWRATVGAG